MTALCSDVLTALAGKTLATAESCTGGMIGAGLTSVPGASSVYKGGIICYTNEVKHQVLGVGSDLLETCGAVSAPVALAMAEGVRKVLKADVALSVTGLAGPGGDAFGNEVGTVFIGYADGEVSCVEEYHFPGNREEVRRQAAESALKTLLAHIK